MALVFAGKIRDFFSTPVYQLDSGLPKPKTVQGHMEKEKLCGAGFIIALNFSSDFSIFNAKLKFPDMSPFLAELIGTAILILLGNGVVANVVLDKTKGAQSGWIVITFGWSMAVFVAVLVAQDYSGAHINPAVTIGLALAGKFPWASVGPYLLAQFLGGALGATLVWLAYRQHYHATEDKSLKLATFCTAPQIRHDLANLFSEMLGTFVLLFAVFSLTGPNLVPGNPGQPVGLGSLGALPVGLIVLAIGLSLGGTTGYAINPARDLAPRLMHTLLPVSEKGSSHWDYAWIPVIGPLLGGALAAGAYLAIS